MSPPFARKKFQLAAICSACTGLVLAVLLAAPYVRGLGFLEQWELRFRNLLIAHGKQTPADPRLLYLAIDDASVSIDPLDLKTLFASVPRDSTDFRALGILSQQWPWPREIYALLLDKLFTAGARVVVLDLMFPKPARDAHDDELFRAVLERYRDRVVIGSNFVLQSPGDGAQSEALTLPVETLIPQTDPLDPRTAFVNFWPDSDGEIRRARFRLNAGFAEPMLSLAARAVTAADLGGTVPPGIDVEHIFRYTAPPGIGFRPHSVYELFVPKYWKLNFDSGAGLRDKIVVVGPLGNWAHDEHETPLGKMPGPELHLNAVNALLHQEFLTETPPWLKVGLVFFSGLVAWVVSLFSPRPTLQMVRFFACNGAAVAAALTSFNLLAVFLPTMAMLIAFNLSGAICFVFEFGMERRDRARTRRTLERYVSKDVVRELLDNRLSLLHTMSGERRPITVLFSDLRGFTSLTESAEAVDLVAQLNEYFQRMVRIVFANGGTLDKFIGDGLMAHWGSIVSQGETADACNAVRTAVQMRGAMRQLNEEWTARGWPTLGFGIGINSGDAVVGNLGCDEKMEVSVIGDPVNLASRIEGTTKQYRTDLLIGEEVAKLVAERFLLRTVDQLRVIGKSRPVEVFAVLGERDQSEAAGVPEWLRLYEEAIRRYRQREFSTAAELCQEAAQLHPGDWIIEEYRRRAELYASEPPEGDWSGVSVLTEK